MPNLEFEWSLEKLRDHTPDSTNCLVERRESHFSLGLGLTSRCNFDCPMCYYHQSSRIGGIDMSLSLLQELLSSLPRLANIFIGLEGEPFCHPEIFKALDLSQLHTDNLNIVSNGSLISKSSAKRLLDYPIGSIALSIEAAEMNSYSHFRKGGNLALFLNNAAYLVELFGTKVLFHTVLFAENLKSVVSLPAMASKIGIRTISLQLYRPTQFTLKKNIQPLADSRLRTGIEKMAQSAEVNRVKLVLDSFFANFETMQYIRRLAEEYSSILIPDKRMQICQKIFNFTSITTQGKIFPCCGDFTPASLNEKSFDGIFNHEYLRRLRWMYLKNKKKCAPCKTCLHL